MAAHEETVALGRGVGVDASSLGEGGRTAENLFVRDGDLFQLRDMGFVHGEPADTCEIFQKTVDRKVESPGESA